jgi:hypothetical protein
MYSESKLIKEVTFSAYLNVLSRQSHGKTEESDETLARITSHPSEIRPVHNMKNQARYRRFNLFNMYEYMLYMSMMFIKQQNSSREDYAPFIPRILN